MPLLLKFLVGMVWGLSLFSEALQAEKTYNICHEKFWQKAVVGDVVEIDNPNHTCHEKKVVQLALEFASAEVVDALLKKSVDVDGLGSEPLFRAVESGDRNMAAVLLENGVDVNSLNGHSATPLMLASRNGDGEMVELLLGYHADVNAQDSKGNTALILASQAGNGDMLKTLINHGADVNAKNDSGESALMWADRNKNTYGLKILMENGAEEVEERVWSTPKESQEGELVNNTWAIDNESEIDGCNVDIGYVAESDSERLHESMSQFFVAKGSPDIPTVMPLEMGAELVEHLRDEGFLKADISVYMERPWWRSGAALGGFSFLSFVAFFAGVGSPLAHSNIFPAWSNAPIKIGFLVGAIAAGSVGYLLWYLGNDEEFFSCRLTTERGY